MKTNSIRIIAGKYKNRRLKFPNINGLRPTSDQLKETIFNWLTPYISGSICIDAFAGSGSLGIESISRGAKKVIFYELSFKAIQQIKQNLSILEIENFKLYKKDSIKELSNIDITCQGQQQLIIFLDPPFNKNIIPKALNAISQNKNITSSAIIYVETERKIDIDLSSFKILKEKTSSNISAKLITKINSLS